MQLSPIQRPEYKYFSFLGTWHVEAKRVLRDVAARPELWGENEWRKGLEAHTEMRDIWIRYGDVPDDVMRPHFAHWYPAYAKLPSLRPLIFNLMRMAEATHLGGVLITRIPPGGKINAHVDRGWHPEFYNCKLYLVLKSNPQCVFRVGDERVTMKEGELWRINNLVEHDVVNDGDTERMTLIMCMKQEH